MAPLRFLWLCACLVAAEEFSLAGKSVYFLVASNTTFCDLSADWINNTGGGYCGGTLNGIINRLDYIQGMGFDCVWITPVVDANGFMGYDAVNIFDIEPHFGTKESYRVCTALCGTLSLELNPQLSFLWPALQDIPEPHPCWNKDESLQEGEDRSLAERKLLIRRVQKRLQQELLPGKPVWYWSYERDMKDRGWPPLFRAHATVPSADRSFSGTWKRGQREAQLQTCALISQFLDSSEVK
eukprot:g19369.t1